MSECSERFRFNISEVKHDGECSQTFHFDNSDEVKHHSECCHRLNFDSWEGKQGSDISERFHFNSTEVRQLSVRSQRDFILIAVK